MRYLASFCVLFLFWVTLSGFYDNAFLMTLGVLSCIGTLLFARRLGIMDSEGQPLHLLGGAVTYWPWLVWEVIKSAWGVSRIILSPSLPISPQLFKARATQKTDVGLVTYANSITLTPGTISIDIEGEDILVHALTRDTRADLEGGAMDARVCRFEGSGGKEEAAA